MAKLCNRRRFLAVSAQAVAGATVTGWAGGFTVIDTHTHFYDPSRPQGVPPRSDKLLYRTVLRKDYRALPVPRPVTGTVVAEASPWVEDNQWVLDLAAKEPFVVGFVGSPGRRQGVSRFVEALRRQ